MKALNPLSHCPLFSVCVLCVFASLRFKQKFAKSRDSFPFVVSILLFTGNDVFCPHVPIRALPGAALRRGAGGPRPAARRDAGAIARPPRRPGGGGPCAQRGRLLPQRCSAR